MKLNLGRLLNGYMSFTKQNTNNAAIENAVEDSLSKSGLGSNAMTSPLDMNGNRILNIPVPANPTDAARLQDILDRINTGGGGETTLSHSVSIEDYRTPGLSDTATVTAFLNDFANGAITGAVGFDKRNPAGIYSITSPIVVNLNMQSHEYGYLDMSGIKLLRNFTGGTVLTIQSKSLNYIRGIHFRPPFMDGNNLAGVAELTISGNNSLTTGSLYGCFIEYARVENFRGDGLLITGDFFESVFVKPDVRANSINTTGNCIHLQNLGTGTLSSIDIIAPNTSGGLHGIYAEGNAGQDVRIYGGTSILAYNEGVLFEFSFGTSIFGYHIENNWVSGTAITGTNGAGIRLVGGGTLIGILGNSVNGQLYTVQCYASNGRDMCLEHIKDFASVPLGLLTSDGTCGFVLKGHSPSEFTINASVPVVALNHGIVVGNSFSPNQQFFPSAASITPSAAQGSLIKVVWGQNLVVNNPTGTPYEGQRFTFVFLIQAPGSFTLSFGTQYGLRSGATLTGAQGLALVIEFVYMSRWHQVGMELVT